jgi:spore coat protein CotH
MTVNYPESLNEVATDWIGIELRGASSLKYEKNSFGIDIFSGKSTDDHVSRSYFNLKKNSKWILDAMYIDKARCRKKVSNALWESTSKTGDQTTVRSVYTEVFLNNKSLGLYCFTENYSEEFLNLNSQSVLYKGIDNSLVTYFNELPSGNPASSKWADWEQKFPNPSERIVWDDFKSLSELIVNGSDAAFTESIASMINLDNVIDYYLFINLCGGADNLGKNWQFLKYSPTAKFIIVPWDLDATWGRNATGDMQTFENQLTNRLFERLQSSNPENYNQRLKQRWHQLRSEQFSESHLIALFSDNFSSLQHSTILETENRLYQQSLNLQQEQAYIATWIINRLHYLDELFQ